MCVNGTRLSKPGIRWFLQFLWNICCGSSRSCYCSITDTGTTKFLNKAIHPVDSLKLLLQVTAVDMRPPEMGTNDYNFFSKTGTYDYISGAGMVDADSAMRTFASPRPFEIRLEKPTNIIPCQDPFVLTIIGENFSKNSKVYLVEGPGDSTIIIPTYISKDTILVTITSCVGNPEILVYSPPRPPVTEFDDGGFSNSIKIIQ